MLPGYGMPNVEKYKMHKAIGNFNGINLQQFRSKKVILTTYSLYIILLSAACSDFSKTLVSQLLFIAFSVFLLFKKNNKWHNDEFGFKFILFGFLIILIQYTITSIFMPGSVKYILTLVCIYFMVKEYKSYFTESLMQTIYRLVLITIPFYVLQISNLNLLKSILAPFNFSFAQQADIGGLYVLLFNFNPEAVYRNSGFMWEPGAFGGILIFLIIYEYIKNNKILNKKILFLSLYALTTISTTTFLGLLMFTFLILIKKNKKKPIILLVSLPLFLLAAIEIYSLPFISGKLDFYFNNNLDYATIDENINEGYTTSTSIGRFSGLLIVLEKLPESPLVGNGWDNDYSDLGLSNEWSNPNGLASILGKFGIAGILFLIYGLYSFVSYSKKNVFFEDGVIVLILLFPIFSNPFESNIIMWTLVMTGIYMQIRKRYSYNYRLNYRKLLSNSSNAHSY